MSLLWACALDCIALLSNQYSQDCPNDLIAMEADY